MFSTDNPTTTNTKTPHVSPGTYSPITVHMVDTLGVVFLGVVAWISLIGWMRAEVRNRDLMAQLNLPHGR